jgi:hypothetical protein
MVREVKKAIHSYLSPEVMFSPEFNLYLSVSTITQLKKYQSVNTKICRASGNRQGIF